MRHVAAQLRGQWIALHNGEVVESGFSLDEVMLRLHRHAFTVMRVPAEEEAELVGLG